MLSRASARVKCGGFNRATKAGDIGARAYAAVDTTGTDRARHSTPFVNAAEIDAGEVVA